MLLLHSTPVACVLISRLSVARTPRPSVVLDEKADGGGGGGGPRAKPAPRLTINPADFVQENADAEGEEAHDADGQQGTSALA